MTLLRKIEKEEKTMIDIHSHIIFEVDDGAKSLEQSIKILEEAKKVGFEKIIVTPHYIEGYYEKDKKEIENRIGTIKEELEKVNCSLEILQGNEIYITDQINELLEKEKASTLNNKQYVLFELPLNAETMNLTEVVYQILEKGRIPILAHPERYPFVQKDPNQLLPLIEEGVLIQSNYGSIIGQYGKESQKTIKKMLEHNMVHLLGSDVHRPNTIYKRMEEALQEITKIVGRQKAEDLTTNYPEQIITGQTIEIENPIPVKTTFFSKIFH